MTPHDGFVIRLKIKRADGSIDDYGDVHNVMGPYGYAPLPTLDGENNLAAFYPQVTCHSAPVKVALPGTFNQTAFVINRQSGAFDLNTVDFEDTLRFSTGEFAGKISNGGSTAANMNRSQSVATTTLDHYRWSLGNGSPIQTVTPSNQTLHNRSYSAGVIEWTSTGFSFPLNLGSPYTLGRITYSWTGLGGGFGSGAFFDIPVPVTVGTGDQIIITSSILRGTWSTIAPKVFAVSPMTGLVGSGRFQRLFRASEFDSTLDARIYLVSDANKLDPIPDMIPLGGGLVSVGSITKIETIVANIANQVLPNVFNDYNGGYDVSGSVTVGGTVKQIFIGDPFNMRFVIEYDTPITLAPGDILTLRPRIRRTPAF